MTRMVTRDSHGRADIGAAALALVAQIPAAQPIRPSIIV